MKFAAIRTAVVVWICLIALVVGAVAAFRYVERTHARPIADFSKMVSVRSILSQALAAHYEQYRSYPRSLTELPLETLPWGDEGSSARDVAAFTYVSDGSTFTMTWTNSRGTEVFTSGRTGQMYYQR